MQDLTITHVKREKGSFNMEEKHYHEQYEIYYLLTGERNYFIDKRSYHVKKGDLILIDKNILHKTTTINKKNPAHERILLQFEENSFNNLKSEMKTAQLFSIFKANKSVLNLNPEQQLWLEEKLFLLLNEKYQNNKAEHKLSLLIKFIEILIFIKRIAGSLVKENIIHPDQKHENISQIATYISQNFTEKLSLTRLAKQFNYSPAYLSRAFKEVTGFNFVEYKNNVRIKEAGKLLQQTQLSITEIASQVGYNNITHFGRIFKSYTKLSPLEYRKLKQI
ncbi:AraC family transcriptional regulator [Halanaerobium salsuginis]|jgi:YesN/AraC family two-component response regulator|uniref:AraC-type DNA-binding protein n=1 Tax=Halanaerobium salsuginis TaxID=29563 RepID=A0A1I4ETN5_9FIRM|nr:AraC family transcriptional regulator [Halanaerobium salsuginis]SFL07876.1 AraC-type DNA-binding protein [Halanaerobium salsuginis]